MPLATASKDKSGVQQYVNLNRVPVAQQRPPQRSMTPQPNPGRERALQDQDAKRRKSQGPSYSKDKENMAPPSREEAANMKLDVPDTRPKSKLAQVIQPNAVQHQSAPQQKHHAEQAPVEKKEKNVFDETLSFQYHDSLSVDDDQITSIGVPFNYSQRRESPRPQGGPKRQIFQSLYGDTANSAAEEEVAAALGGQSNWMFEADAERARQGVDPKYNNRFSHNMYSMHQDEEEEYDEGSEQDGDIEEGRSLIENTPSRTRVVPEHKVVVQTLEETTLKTIKAEEAAKPSLPRHRKSFSDVPQPAMVEPPLRQQIAHSRFHGHKVPVSVPQETNIETQRTTPQQVIYAPQPRPAQVSSAAFASKASSLHESSSEEEQPPLPHIVESPKLGIKRPLPTREVDFDPKDLKNKTMAELDSIPFTADPRLPSISPAMDSNGQIMPLSTKLINLTKMRLEDQGNLFRTLNDAEREQTADWFLEKFRGDMQRLMAVRVQRRQIALKYEMKVKKREKQVLVKKGDVEEELSGLRKGGTDLVRGKSPAKN